MLPILHYLPPVTLSVAKLNMLDRKHHLCEHWKSQMSECTCFTLLAVDRYYCYCSHVTHMFMFTKLSSGVGERGPGQDSF